jgi:aminopeptidase YwaD
VPSSVGRRWLSPPLPSVRDLHQEQPALSDIEIGALMGEVSYDNIADTVGTLQGIGAGDGASLGTRYYTLTGNQIAAEYLFQEMESYGLKVWYEDFLTPEGILLVNVVGEVPGMDTSAVYGVMAHFDTISEAPGTAPGADDNATGIAVSLEIARILAGYTLEHPVRIVFVNAEEVGILGSNVWARNAQAKNVPIEGVFNVDSVGSDRQGRLLIFNSDARSAWMQDIMIEMNTAYSLGNEIMSRQNPAIVADDNMVREQGIEAVMIARELYGWSPYHHSSGDVMDHVSVDNVMSTTYVVLLSVASLVR